MFGREGGHEVISRLQNYKVRRSVAVVPPRVAVERAVVVRSAAKLSAVVRSVPSVRVTLAAAVVVKPVVTIAGAKNFAGVGVVRRGIADASSRV